MEAFTETGRAIFGKPPPCTKLYHGCMAYILENMARDGCYGDHLTLQAAAELFKSSLLSFLPWDLLPQQIYRQWIHSLFTAFILVTLQKAMVSTT